VIEDVGFFLLVGLLLGGFHWSTQASVEALALFVSQRRCLARDGGIGVPDRKGVLSSEISLALGGEPVSSGALGGCGKGDFEGSGGGLNHAFDGGRGWASGIDWFGFTDWIDFFVANDGNGKGVGTFEVILGDGLSIDLGHQCEKGLKLCVELALPLVACHVGCANVVAFQDCITAMAKKLPAGRDPVENF